jgi:AcrR family transcriptional regulator
VQLMLSEDFDAITVQQVLDRAHVSRSTFYTHFRNTDDLLLTDAERFLDALEAHFLKVSVGTRRVAPVAELLYHVREFREFVRALERAGKKDVIDDLFIGHFARLIERRVRILVTDPDTLAIPVAVVSQMFAGALMELLGWSLDRDARCTPAWADERFHSMVWHGLQQRGYSDG